MPTFYGPPVNGNQLRMDVSWTQSVAGNYSDVYVSLYYIGQWAASANTTIGIGIDGVQAYWYEGSQTWGTGTTFLASASHRVYHNPDGTRSVTLAGATNMPFSIGSLSVTALTMTLPTIPRQPSAPTKPWISAFGTTTLTVEFRHQGSIGATSFQLQRATNSGFTSGVVTTNTGTSGTIPVSGLTPGTTYYFRARAQNAAGWSAWSPTLTTYTQPLPDTPFADSITATGMRVRFNSIGGGAGSTTWTLERATNAAFTQNVVSVASTGTTVLSGLTPGTTYYFRARGQNASGLGPWSGVATATTLGLNAPTLSVVSGDTGAAATATIGAPGGAVVTNYTLEAEYLAPLPKPSGADKSIVTTSTNPTVTGLIPGATYRWRVRANVGSYSTDWSDWATVTQVNPNTLDEEYFDASITSPDPDITRAVENVAGIAVQVERVITPNLWEASPDFLTIRRGPENMVESEGSTRNARVKAIRPLDSVWRNVYLRGNSPYQTIPALTSATYTAKVFVKTTAAADMQMSLVWYDEDGTPFDAVSTAPIQTVPGQIHELTMLAKTPVNATSVGVIISTRNVPFGTLIDLDGGFFALGRPEGYFDGGTPNTFRFLHEWEGEEWNSKSLRHLIPGGVEPDPFQDPLCPTPPSPPRPPALVNECIPDVSTWRRYFSPIDAEAVSAAFDSLPTFTVTTGDQADGPIRIQIFENPDNLSTDDFVPTVPISEQVITYLPANSEAVLDAVSERAYGRLLSSDTYTSIDHLVFGASGGPAMWPVVGCNMAYMAVLDVPSTSPLGNVELSAALTTRMG